MSALDNVKNWLKDNYATAYEAFAIPCEDSSKEHECPLCGKRKFRVRTKGTAAGTYICTCGVKGCGFGVLDLIARKELGASADEKISGATIRSAAKLVDERLNLGFFNKDPTYTPPTPEQREARERERNEAFEQRRREAAEQEAQQIVAAGEHVRDVLSKANLNECAYLRAKGFDDCLLPVSAMGDGIVSLIDIDDRYRSIQYLPAPDALDSEGQKRHKSLMKDAPISGAFIDVQPNPDANTLIITEGYATARSVTLAEPFSHVIAAISAANIKNVATAFRERFPALEIIIAADNDYHAPGDTDTRGRPKQNTGLLSANAAAAATGALVVFPGCLGHVKQDWDDVRTASGIEQMTGEFKRELAKARTARTTEGAAQSDEQTKAPATISQRKAPSRPEQPEDDALVGSIRRIPLDLDIVNYYIPNKYKKYSSDKVTPQELWPDGTKIITERDDLSVVFVDPITGRGKDGESGVFKWARITEVVRGVIPTLRGYKDNEAYITFESLANPARRLSVPWSMDARHLAAALRSLGAEIAINTPLTDLYRNDYLTEQELPTAIYGAAPGWQHHEGKPFYVSQAGNTYLTDDVRYEFTTPIEARFRARPAGTLKEYRESVINLVRDNGGITFQILLELAAVLFPVRSRATKAEGITFNVYGASGAGKTLALKVGASVWGDHSTLTESANATYTALVNSAVKSSGGVMRIDDLSAMGNIRGSDCENLIYSIGNGKGKLRSAVDGKNIQADEFSVICLMTAEKTIADEVWQKEGYRFKAGAEARLIEQPFAGLTDLAGVNSIAAYAERVTDAINQHNGALGAAWLDLLHVMGWEALQKALRSYILDFDNYMAREFPDAWLNRPGFKVRAHQIYAVTYAAGMLSLELTGLNAEGVMKCVVDNICLEMVSNDMGERRDREAVSALWEFLTANTNNMGAIAREGNRANLQRGGNESMGWLDLVETERHEEYAPVFYLNKKQLNAAAKEVCGMAGSDLLALLNKYGYHETPNTERGARDGTVQRRVRVGQTTSILKLVKISEPEDQE